VKHDFFLTMGLKRPTEEETSPQKKTVQEKEEELEFEDRWDSDSEESMHESELDEDEDLNSKMENLQVYLPGGEMEEGEVLVVDQSTYDMLHQMNVEWPCLSFDVIKDKLGSGRESYPKTAYIVAGSQAQNNDNKVYVMKMSHLQKTIMDDGSDSDSDGEGDDDPVLEYKTIKHEGGVNRIRTMDHHDVHIAATMAETGKVHIFDITQEFNSFDTPGLIPPKNPKPIHTILNHGTVEGYGIDFSPLEMGTLLTGDGKGRILLTKKTSNGFVSEKSFFVGHTSSIEDLQWSPSQGNVFASCSADKTIKIWDARVKKPQLSVLAHKTDVNVISWSR
jgi:ribosome assembly protein RRB1